YLSLPEAASRIADEVRIVAGSAPREMEGIVDKILQIPDLIRRQALDGAQRDAVCVTEPAQIEMSPLLAHIAGVEEDFSGQFLLKSEAPSLLVRDIFAYALDGANRGKSDVVERAQRAARSWR